MADKDISENTLKKDVLSREGEAQFDTERHSKPFVVAENPIQKDLQLLSPGRPVYLDSNLTNLEPQQLALLQNTLKQCADLCGKVDDPLRNVYSNTKRQEMSGQGGNSDWADNYVSKVSDVVQDVMKELGAGMPFRMAFPVQCFMPGKNGQMKAETLYCFFPPLEPASIQERYITMALHSPDLKREAELRAASAEPSRMCDRISSHEFQFRCKTMQVNGKPLLPRRSREDAEIA